MIYRDKKTCQLIHTLSWEDIGTYIKEFITDKGMSFSFSYTTQEKI